MINFKGAVTKLDMFADGVVRFEYYCSALDSDSYKFTLHGPWRKSNREANIDGVRLKDLAEHIASELSKFT